MTGRFILFGTLSAALWHCGEAPLPPTDATPATPGKARVTPDAGVSAAVIAEQYQYSYSPVGKRDPFRSLAASPSEAGPATPVGQSPCDEVLCQFDLDDLKLVAVVSGDANPIAMVEDRNGVGHVLRRNSKVGRQAGKVTAILRDCVVVTSFIAGPDGRQQPNRQSLCVSPEGGTSPVLDLMNGRPRE
jgi:type IV pilus assembly protein PilP